MSKVSSTPCIPGKTHQIEERALMCLNCNKLGQETSHFKGEECCKSRLLAEKEETLKQLRLQIQCQLAHQRKLMVIKNLEMERERMSRLLFEKRNFQGPLTSYGFAFCLLVFIKCMFQKQILRYTKCDGGLNA